jgi:hypothetical protein
MSSGPSDNRIVIPAIHDWHLEKVLQDLGVLANVREGLAACEGCGKKVTLENLSAIRLGPNHTILFVCDGNDCLATVWTKGA